MTFEPCRPATIKLLPYGGAPFLKWPFSMSQGWSAVLFTSFSRPTFIITFELYQFGDTIESAQSRYSRIVYHFLFLVHYI